MTRSSLKSVGRNPEKNSPQTVTSYRFPSEVLTPVTEGWPSFWAAATLNNYTWIIWKGFRRVIQLKDLVALQKKYTSSFCWSALNAKWKGPTAESDTLSDSQRESTTASKTERKKRPKSLGRSIMSAFWGFILCSSLLELLFDIVRLLPVYVLSKVINFMASKRPLEEGYQYCLLFFVNGLGMAFLTNWLIFVSCSGGVQVRSSLISAMYHKSLAVTNAAYRQFTTGDLLNLMSVDVDHVFEFCQFSTLIWGAIIRIISSIIIIWLYLGPSCLAGLLVIVACVPFTVALGKAAAKYENCQLAEKDRRLDALNEIFSGIKIIKLFAWEIPFIKKVESIRKVETGWIRKYLIGQAAITFLWYCSPFLVTCAAFGTFIGISRENVLTPEKAFISLFLFNNMRFSLTFLPINVTMLLKALVSLKRIEKFLQVDEIQRGEISHDLSGDECINFKDVNLNWDEKKTILSNLNFSIKSGELVAVIGRVGAGKSSLLNAILGEMTKTSGSINVKNERIAYVPQQAWIQNETVRQNILFTASYDNGWYRKVVKSCNMESDMKLFPAGDMTEIGEKGVNLSGGQKQRVSVARAVYQKANIYLLDDPLSAVDAHVASSLFEDVIGPKGLLRGTTRVLVTHSVNVLPFVDRILVLEGGKITHTGTLKEILEMDISIRSFLIKPKLEEDRTLRGSGSIFDETSVSVENPVHFERASSRVSAEICVDSPIASLIADENVAIGGVKWSVYWNLMRHFGVIAWLCVLFGFSGYRCLDAYSTVWLGKWSDDPKTILANFTLRDENMTMSSPEVLDAIHEKSFSRIIGFLYLGGGQAIAVIIASFCLAVGCLSASSTLHSEMLWAIMKSPMSFFDSTPLGRMVNRFGKDVNVLDLELFLHLDGWLDSVSQVIATVILICIEIPVFLVFVAPMSIIYFLMQKIYIGSARQFRRLLSTTRSPVLNNFSETINGASTIRAYGAEDYFMQKCYIRVDLNQNCYFHSMAASRWIALRIDILSALMIGVISCLVVHYRDRLSAGVAGLLLSYSLLVCDSVSWMIRVGTEVEKAVVAAERIDEYTKVESEAPWELEDSPVIDGNWPLHGEIRFEDYSTRYRADMDDVLKNINLEIRSGEKVGVVGRTGAGKSSLTLALFRIIEASRGKIIIDDVDTSQLGLHDLRGRLTMIPQDPVLFRGTIRSNLDPHSQYSDEKVWSAIEKAHLKNQHISLDFEVSEAGGNLSVGERQLICLARALLRKSRIILLDEATAAVDMQTDALIQETIRRDFKDCTIITIAHRLHTVVDYDTIVVLGQGKIIEVGNPKKLLADKQSQFHSMAKEAGLV